jgi:hypothetical protein
MDSLKVWVKIEGESDETAEVVRVQAEETVSDLKHVLYADPAFAFAPGAIDCLLVRGEDGSEKVGSSRTFCLHCRFSATVIQWTHLSNMKCV